ncbi:DUF3558 domain-containing protein [Lentzea sp. NPDC051838]|uniref:DUF3558 domain-containing protein n=1 Tax=Lentzea sp. NPDC051838 TaxID=3154849 RepID=UPI00341B290F
MNKASLKIIAAASLLLAVAACTSSGEKGKPNPTSGASPTSGSSDSAGELPKRPADLKLDGVDACKLLTQAQMDQVRVAETVPQKLEVAGLGEAPGCFYENGLKYTYAAALITNKGVPFWLKGSGNVDAKVVDVAGYGAAQLTLTGTQGFDCAVAVDVAEGQQLHFLYSPGSEKGDSQDQLCSKVNKAAALAVETLKTLK